RAKAGIHSSAGREAAQWIPACAGKPVLVVQSCGTGSADGGVEALVVERALQRHELGAKIAGVRRVGVSALRLGVAPDLEDRQVVEPSLLLPQLEPQMACFLASRRGKRLQQ